MINDDIKQILRDLEFASGVFDYTITPNRCTFLKDYITNLQQKEELFEKIVYKYDELKQENERLKETNVYCNRTDCVGRIKDSKKYDSVYQEKENYKSRCEKANEFINENTELEHDGDDYGYMEWINIINMDTMTFINNLSDILNGRSDE